MKLKIKFSSIIKLVLLLPAAILYGCTTSGDYLYKSKLDLPEKEDFLETELKQEKDWLQLFFEENNLTKQCPGCLRRYPAAQNRCPYDNLRLREAVN